MAMRYDHPLHSHIIKIPPHTGYGLTHLSFYLILKTYRVMQLSYDIGSACFHVIYIYGHKEFSVDSGPH
jgi:hypothetical protein